MKNFFLIGVLNFENYNATISCLDSIIQQNFINFHLLILDNGSTNKSYIFLKRYIKRYSSKISLIKSKSNLGFMGGHNRILDYSKKNNLTYKFYFSLNSDTYLDQNFLKNLYLKVNQKSKYLMYGFKVFNQSTNQYTVAHQFNTFFGNITNLKTLPGFNRLYYPSGSATLFKKSFFKQIGIFDEDLFFYGDELDFVLRLRNKNKSFYIFEDLVVNHKEGSSVPIDKKKKVNLFSDFFSWRARLIIMDKHFFLGFYRAKIMLITFLLKRMISRRYVNLSILLFLIMSSKNKIKQKSYNFFKNKFKS